MKNRILSSISRSIPYIKELRPLAKSVTGVVLMQQLDFWFERYPNGFFKFMAPAENHPKYKKGKSWVEELGFSEKEFGTAFDNVGIRYRSRTAVKEAQRAQGIFTRPDGSKAFYCSFFDRRTGETWYLRNHAVLDFELDHVFQIYRDAQGREFTETPNGNSQKLPGGVSVSDHSEFTETPNGQMYIKRIPKESKEEITEENTCVAPVVAPARPPIDDFCDIEEPDVVDAEFWFAEDQAQGQQQNSQIPGQQHQSGNTPPIPGAPPSSQNGLSQQETTRQGAQHSPNVSQVTNQNQQALEGAGEDDPLLPKYDPEGFLKFWKNHPVRKRRRNAVSAWNKLKPSAELQERLRQDQNKRKTQDQDWVDGFAVHPSTYLNERIWQEEMKPLRVKQSSADRQREINREGLEEFRQQITEKERNRANGNGNQSFGNPGRTFRALPAPNQAAEEIPSCFYLDPPASRF